jgi:predicted ATPase
VTEIEFARPNELGGGTWVIKDVTTLTVVFGKNGSGKSKLLRQWRSLNPDEHHYIVPERAGEIDYQANYLSDQLNSSGRSQQSQRNFGGEYRRQIVARISAYFAARGDFRGAVFPNSPSELEALLVPLLPDFEIGLTGTSAPPYNIKRVKDQTAVQNIDQLSSGETQVLTLALDILTIAGIWDSQSTGRRFLLIDEPDAHIHPDLQVRFADFLWQTMQRFKLQVVIATHSTTLLAALGQFAKTSCSVLYLERNISEMKAQKFDDVSQELASCLGGHALMGPLFGAPILLVEGDDDYRIWSQVPRYHHVNFAAIAGEGDKIKKYQRSLEQVFTALRDDATSTSGYALIDADKGKPQPSVEWPQAHVRYIQLICRESENLYLTDEVLDLMGKNWEAARLLIKEKAANFGEKEERLLALADADRAQVDLKNLMEALTEILDEKRVLWTLRVARALGVARPANQIADFLGNEVLAALWGESSDTEPEATT